MDRSNSCDLSRPGVAASSALPDPSFLAVAAELSDTVFVYRIDTANGELVETCTIAVGATPNWITMISIEGPVS